MKIKIPIAIRLKACWVILIGKEFYMEAVISRYADGDILESWVLSNIPETETVIKKLQESLKMYLRMIKQERSRKNVDSKR